MRSVRWTTVGTLTGACLLLGACENPMSRDATELLREQIIQSQRRQMQASGTADPRTPHTTEPDAYIHQSPDLLTEIDRDTGPQRLAARAIDPGPSLTDQPPRVLSLSLEQAVRRALRHNLDIAQASLQPAITEAELVAAEAAFDAVYFATGSFQKLDRPQPVTEILFPVGAGVRRSDVAQLSTGIRQPLATGGQITASSGFEYTRNRTPGITLTPDPAWISNVLLGIEQPLLRNFGSDINRAQIALSRTAHTREVLRLHGQMLNTIAAVEEAYWQLVLAQQNLAVQEELLDMITRSRDILLERVRVDVLGGQEAQAQATVEQSRSDVVRARQLIRDTSDQLKRLMNDPSLPLTDETLILPIDRPIELPVRYNLLDAITTAFAKRPETRIALLGIDDASLRMQVADNQRLPVLNLNAQVQFFGMNDNFSDSYHQLGEGDFIEYLIGGQFEMPIGNRQAEARFRRTRIERQSAVVAYRQTVQAVAQEVKQAMRDLQASFERIGLAREARRSAAEWIRVLTEREARVEALTPEFVDRKLRAQQLMAGAQLREVQSMVEYNLALMRMELSKGTLLEHNQIEMVWPRGTFADE